MSIKSPDSILCFKDLYFLATQHAGAQVGKPRKGKNGGRRRIVLTVHSLEKQQQQISNSAAAAVLQWHHCCFGLLTLGHAGDYTCLECPAVHNAQCSEQCSEQCSAQCTMHSAGRRTGLTGREAAGGLSDFRIWSKPGWSNTAPAAWCHQM